MTILLVALGGAIGAAARYICIQAALRAFGGGFPYGVMAANVLGSVLMGAAAVWIARKGAPSWGGPLLLTGVLGGFTTFSAFSLDAYGLLVSDRYAAAAVYMGGSVALAVAGLILGVFAARSLGV